MIFDAIIAQEVGVCKGVGTHGTPPVGLPYVRLRTLEDEPVAEEGDQNQQQGRENHPRIGVIERD